MQVSKKMINSVCLQNGHTLQTLHLKFCKSLDLESIKSIAINCVELVEVNLACTHLSKDSINFLTNILTRKIEKLSLCNLSQVTDRHVNALAHM